MEQFNPSLRAQRLAMIEETENDSIKQQSAVSKQFAKIGYLYQFYLDSSVPHTVPRWIVLALLFVLYFIRIILHPGWYIVSYALGIYLLSLFLAFLTPKVDPALQRLQEDEDGPSLPTKQSEEFRPFIRRLPEFKFWHSATRAVTFALIASCFKFTDVPVFWPILVIYFIVLVFVTMKKQIKHMVKYRYIPMTRGKTVYQGKPEAS